MVVIFIKMKALPVKRKELWQTVSSIVAEIRKESGNLNAGVYQSVENVNELLLMEEWATKNIFDAHLDSDTFTVLRGAESLMSQPLEFVVRTADKSTICEESSS